ncbi:MAG: isocitrate lyase/PEP mutase family protein [Sulfitobacter sp.]
MNTAEKARAFAALHVAGAPLVLCNAWDAGSAKIVAQSGAAAVASGSWGVAAALGFADGEALPLGLAVAAAAQMVNATDLPVSFDFEGGYAPDPAGLAANLAQLLSAGIVGINFEDRVVGGAGLYALEVQAERIAALRGAADAAGRALFINARTDVFFCGDPRPAEELLEEAAQRAQAYADAGASGLFVPGVEDEALVRAICAQSPLPVNVMRSGQGPTVGDFAQWGAARISHGPGPYRAAMQALREFAQTVHQEAGQ